MKSIEFAKLIRIKCLELSHRKKTSHLGGSFSIADVLAVLYSNVLKYDVRNVQLEIRDRLFYSKGHACMALYATLEGVGFYSKLEEKFTINGEYFTSHINHNVPGVELSTGSLGHALSVAVGVSLAGKKKTQAWRTFTIVSDGELDEGSNWEAILLAPHLKLDNMVLIVDYNKIQSFGMTNEVLNLEPLNSKFVAFNWNVFEVDGHDHFKLKNCFDNIPMNGKPSVIIAHTVKGKGVSFMEHKLEWHYKSPTADQFEQALKELQL
jgi:transketolase